MESQHHSSKINWTAIALFGIAVIGFLSWNYIQTIKEKNSIEKERIESEKQAAQDKLSQEQQAKQDEIFQQQQEKAERSINLSACLSRSQANYSSNWDSSCATLSNANKSGYDNCILTSSMSMSYCQRIYPSVEPADCSLPSVTAGRWDELKKTDDQHCYDEFGT